ncbi:hypothetical protein Kisp01_65410 [Kineosporia sp. NBRC 101677]|nr:hypothetical protein Kisp01_65410 [Kineosporia sp. NBRC 101677]
MTTAQEPRLFGPELRASGPVPNLPRITPRQYRAQGHCLTSKGFTQGFHSPNDRRLTVDFAQELTVHRSGKWFYPLKM